MNDKPDRKQEILQAAIACFNEPGIRATSIDAIRTPKRRQRRRIYHHFGNKRHRRPLFLNGLDDYWQRLLAALQQAVMPRQG